MTATITNTELAAFTKKLGFESLTDIESEAFIEAADSVDSSFAVAGYTDAKIKLIKLYLCAMLSINGVLDITSRLFDDSRRTPLMDSMAHRYSLISLTLASVYPETSNDESTEFAVSMNASFSMSVSDSNPSFFVNAASSALVIVAVIYQLLSLDEVIANIHSQSQAALNSEKHAANS